MIEVNLYNLPEEAFQRYFKALIGRIFKVLPMTEEGSETLKEYLENLSTEMIGCYELYRRLIDEPDFMSVISNMQYLSQGNCDVAETRKKVFNSISIIESLIKKVGDIDAKS